MYRLNQILLLVICFTIWGSCWQALALNPAVWDISGSTQGEDVFWSSPTAVDLGLPRYYTSFEITRVEVYTALGGTDVTGLLDATSGAGIIDSLPVTLIDDTIADATTGTTATVFVEIDGSGYAQASFTDITLGTIFFLPINQIDVDVTVSVQGLVPGDFDENFVVDSLDYSLWEGSFGSNANADTDFDSDSDGIDFLDWQRYFGSDYTSAPSAAVVVPEPASLTMIALVALGWLGTLRVSKK